MPSPSPRRPERMKANREHRVPLSKRALEVLAEAAKLSDGSGLVFPGMRPDRPLSENTHAKLLRELGFDAVTHGFRLSFRDYAAEQTHAPPGGEPPLHGSPSGASRHGTCFKNSVSSALVRAPSNAATGIPFRPMTIDMGSPGWLNV